MRGRSGAGAWEHFAAVVTACMDVWMCIEAFNVGSRTAMSTWPLAGGQGGGEHRIGVRGLARDAARRDWSGRRGTG